MYHNAEMGKGPQERQRAERARNLDLREFLVFYAGSEGAPAAEAKDLASIVDAHSGAVHDEEGALAVLDGITERLREVGALVWGAALSEEDGLAAGGPLAFYALSESVAERWRNLTACSASFRASSPSRSPDGAAAATAPASAPWNDASVRKSEW